MRRLFFVLMMGLILNGICFAEEQQPLGLAVGVQAPDFQAVTHDGSSVQLSALLGEGPVVLVFYRGSWCMYCNMQLQALEQRLEDFKKHSARIVAISVDLQANAAKSVEEKQLGFTVVSDPGADLLKLYNVVYHVPDELAAKYKEKYNIDLEAASGRTDHVIAVPATYVIDTSGTIAFAYANEDYKVRANPNDVLDVLAGL